MRFRRLMSILLSASIMIGSTANMVLADESVIEESFVETDQEDPVEDLDEAAESSENEHSGDEQSEENTEVVEVELDEEYFGVTITDQIDTCPCEETSESVDVEVEEEDIVFELLNAYAPSEDDIEISEDNFPDEAFLNYVIDELDDGNGWLTPDEIESITAIDVSGLGITSLTGIEYFTHLQILDCHTNAISYLDLSNNPSIIRLFTQDNNIALLDVTPVSVLAELINNDNPNFDVEGYVQYESSDSILTFDYSTELITSFSIVFSVCFFGANGTDSLDDLRAFSTATRKALDTDKTLVLLIPSGTYFLSLKVPVYSDTVILAAADAVMISTQNDIGAMLDSEHTVDGTSSTGRCRGDSCVHGDYSQACNITIDGGVWDRGSANTDYQTTAFLFRHSNHITLRNMTVRNCTSHFVNVSGSSDVLISNVVFSDALDSPSYTDPSRYYICEVIHTDYINDLGENSDIAKPLDNTPTINLTVTGCTFNNVMSGIGTHNAAGNPNRRASGFTITNNTFIGVSSYCFCANCFDGVEFSNNNCISCNAIALVYDSTDVTIDNNTQSDVFIGPHSDKTRSMIYVSGSYNCTISNNTINKSFYSGIQVSFGSNTINIEDNTINDSTEFAIQVQTPVSHSGAFTSNVRVVNNTVNGTADNFHGMRFYRLGGINTIDGNHILFTNSGSSDGIEVWAVDNITLSNNDITNVGRYGIHLMYSDDATVSRNTIVSVPNTAILIEGDNVTRICGMMCEDNIIINAGGHGIHLQYCDSCTVRRNKITDPASGWQVRAEEGEGCTNCVVEIFRTGWFKSEGKWYYFSSDGVMQKGWKKLSGKWYYFASDGVMQTGWEKISGKWYYLAGSGVMQTGWQKLSGKWYYFNTNGDMKTGWLQSGGKWYHLSSEGVMQTGWQKFSGVWYYFNGGGDMKTGWMKSGGNWYYLDSSGAMVAGTSMVINGVTYYFDSNGVCQNP